MHAAMYGNDEAIVLLLRAGADLGSGTTGVSPADVAMLQGHSDAAKLLSTEAEQRANARAAAHMKTEQAEIAAQRAASANVVLPPQAAASPLAATPQGGDCWGGVGSVAPPLHVDVLAASRPAAPPAKVGHRLPTVPAYLHSCTSN